MYIQVLTKQLEESGHGHVRTSGEILLLSGYSIHFYDIRVIFVYSIDIANVSPSQVIGNCYTYLVEHMDADSVSHLMHTENLITDDEFEVISTAPNDMIMNCLLLQFVELMKVCTLYKFCSLLQKIESQKYAHYILTNGKQNIIRVYN